VRRDESPGSGGAVDVQELEAEGHEKTLENGENETREESMPPLYQGVSRCASVSILASEGLESPLEFRRSP
jgi:hypothetical protein